MFKFVKNTINKLKCLMNGYYIIKTDHKNGYELRQSDNRIFVHVTNQQLYCIYTRQLKGELLR